MTTQSNIEVLLRSIRLVDLLAYFGKRVDHVRYMYYSPFRNEDKPSMRVIQRNGMDLWVDYGAPLTEEDRLNKRANHGGGIIDMAMELGNLTKREAVELLKSIKPDASLIMESSKVSDYRKNDDSSGNVEILSVSDRFHNRTLIDYAVNKRYIPVDILEQYCKEVRYRIKNKPSREYTKIGFANNEGGWVLRGSKGKISTKSGITTFDISGRHTSQPASNRAFVFEGFFDFLSWVAWNGGLKSDACILNSVSNLHRSIEWLSSHKEIGICFDNDAAGRRATEELKTYCPGSFIKDCSQIYKSFNDLNEAYVMRCQQKIMESESTQPPSKGMRL